MTRGAFDHLKHSQGNLLPNVAQTLDLFDPNANYFQSTPTIEQAQTTEEARDILMGMVAGQRRAQRTTTCRRSWDGL